MNSRLQLRCWLTVIDLLHGIFILLRSNQPEGVRQATEIHLRESEDFVSKLHAELALQEKLFESSKSDTRPLV